MKHWQVKSAVIGMVALCVLAFQNCSTEVPGGNNLQQSSNSALQVIFDKVPDNVSASSTAEFQFSTSEGSATFECALNGSSPYSCQSPVVLSLTGAGSYEFQVVARSADGRVSDPATFSWVYQPQASPAPTPTPNPTPSNCTGTITFAGTIKVNDTFGGGSAGMSCTPLLTVNFSLPLGTIPSGTASTVYVGNTPWPGSLLGLATYNAPGCDGSYLFGEVDVACSVGGEVTLNRVGNIRYYSGRVDTGTYVLRATFDGNACVATSNKQSLCAGNDPQGRITVNNGFSVLYNP